MATDILGNEINIGDFVVFSDSSDGGNWLETGRVSDIKKARVYVDKLIKQEQEWDYNSRKYIPLPEPKCSLRQTYMNEKTKYGRSKIIVLDVVPDQLLDEFYRAVLDSHQA